MWNKALLLLLSIILIPALAFYIEPPLDEKTINTLRVLIGIYLLSATACFLVSTLSRNYSQVDKLWSIMPIIYAWTASALFEFEARSVLMATLATIWGVRLTLNFARRGGYSWRFWEGEEDYRWAEVRKRPGFENPFAWALFNLFFISLYQMGLILLFTLPIIKTIGGTALGIWDALLGIAFLLFVFWQSQADNQQWRFQTEKYRRIDNKEELGADYEHGFVRSGLWALARHPNYACEQALWITFYLFSVVASGQILNWTIMGAILLVILFRNSSQLSEEISSLKYPEYKNYIASTPRFIPNFWGTKSP